MKHIERCFIRPFGNRPLIEFTPAFIDNWRTLRLKAGRTTETVNRDVATFKAALSKAVLWGLIEKHPLDRLKLFKSDRGGKIRFLTPDEERRLRAAAIAREANIRADRDNANKWRMERNYPLLPDFSSCTFMRL